MLDVENPEFKRKLDWMVEINEKLQAVGQSEDIPLVKKLKRIPLKPVGCKLLAAYLMKPIEYGSVDFAEFEPQAHRLYISLPCVLWCYILVLVNIMRLTSLLSWKNRGSYDIVNSCVAHMNI